MTRELSNLAVSRFLFLGSLGSARGATLGRATIADFFLRWLGERRQKQYASKRSQGTSTCPRRIDPLMNGFSSSIKHTILHFCFGRPRS